MSNEQYPLSGMERPSDALITVVVHRAVACQILEVRVPEESGVSPHHSVQMKLKRSYPRIGHEGAGDSERPAIGHRGLCARASLLDERSTQLMQSSEHGILGGCDSLRDEARACTGRGSASRWVIRKVTLRELWLTEALPTRRRHLPQQPEQKAPNPPAQNCE